MSHEKDIAQQIMAGEKRLKNLTEKELIIRENVQKLQESRKALEARLGLMRIEANMARDGAMVKAVQEQIKELVSKLKDNSEDIKDYSNELRNIMGFKQQLQEAIAAQKREHMDAAEIAASQGKNQEYEQILNQIETLTDEYNQLRELILNRFEEIKLLNSKSNELKFELDKLRGIPNPKKESGVIKNFVSQTITIPFFDFEQKLLKLDPLTKY